MDEIQVLKGLEAVRRRPKMYVRGVDAEGLQDMVWFLVRDVIDMHLSRAATEVHVEIEPNGWV